MTELKRTETPDMDAAVAAVFGSYPEGVRSRLLGIRSLIFQTAYGLYFNCRTTLVYTFRTLFPELVYDGNRAILLPTDEEPPWDSLAVCITATLTYHRRAAVE